MRIYATYFSTLVCLYSACGSLSPLTAAENSAAASRITNDIKYLASDELEGRGVGTKGLDKAASYIKSEFQKAGLNVNAVNRDAFQVFSMTTGSKLGTPNRLELISPDGDKISLKMKRDFTVCSFGGSGKFNGEVVFAGYGINAKDKNFQEYANVDVKGKIVVIMRRAPQQSLQNGPFGGPHGKISLHAALRTKVNTAISQGASAILIVNDVYTGLNATEIASGLVEKTASKIKALQQQVSQTEDDTQKGKLQRQLAAAQQQLANAKKSLKNVKTDPLMNFGYGGRSRGKSVPVCHITQKQCNQMLKTVLGKSLNQLETEIDKDLTPKSALLEGWKVSGTVTLNTEKHEVKNVIGVLEGAGPLADETVIIGAHYDHVGIGGFGSLAPGSQDVHNGADDNGSGTVSLLELARRISSRDKPPARRIVFIAFTAEERGLIGSAYYAKNPVFPLDKTIAMLNMDMVGRLRDDKLTIFGTGTAKHWKSLIDAEAKKLQFKTTLKPEGFGPSDHSSFYAKKIPVLHFFTGTHKDYHRPGDDWEKINITGMERIIEMIEDVLIDTVERKERPEYVAIKGRARVARSGSRPYFGSMPDFGNDTAKGYAISGVAPGSPAAKGGLKGGDVITQLGQHKISNLEDFDLALRKFKPGQNVDVVVIRKEAPVKLKVILSKPR